MEFNVLITKELKDKIESLRAFGEYQIIKNVFGGLDTSPMIGFEHKESGVFIINPFLDECGELDVHPIEYYGEEFLNSDFMKVDLGNMNKYKDVKIIAFMDNELEYEGSSIEFLDINEFQCEVEEAIFEVIENGYSEREFTSGNWKFYTKEQYEIIQNKRG